LQVIYLYFFIFIFIYFFIFLNYWEGPSRTCQHVSENHELGVGAVVREKRVGRRGVFF